jgi:hypothetical protein
MTLTRELAMAFGLEFQGFPKEAIKFFRDLEKHILRALTLWNCTPPPLWIIALRSSKTCPPCTTGCAN